MIHSNFHTHTCYCDGKNTVDEMVRAAIDKNFRALGFSGHSTLFYEPVYPMSEESTKQYVTDVQAAKTAYAGQIEIYLGVEDDAHGHRPTFARDYTIGSVHDVPAAGGFCCVDHTEEILRQAVRRHFGGDFYRFCAAYYEEAAQIQRITNCDFVGHIDLITKFNEGGRFFDESDPRYLNAALGAIEQLCREGSVFEINTGAMSRGYRSAPYPAPRLLRAIRAFGGAIVISSDSHSAATLDAFFPEAVALAKSCGYETHRVLTARGWQEVPLDEDGSEERRPVSTPEGR